jgi:hypothetical protein
VVGKIVVFIQPIWQERFVSLSHYGTRRIQFILHVGKIFFTHGREKTSSSTMKERIFTVFHRSKNDSFLAANMGGKIVLLTEHPGRKDSFHSATMLEKIFFNSGFMTGKVDFPCHT